MRQALLPRGRKLSTAGTSVAIRGMWLGMAALAVLAAVAGTGLSVRRDAAARASVTQTATLGGLTARPHDAGWLSMDGHNMDNQGGYQMPAQMMPGAPAGDDMRLGVPLTLVNNGGQVRQFNLLDEFFLGGGRNATPRSLHSDTFGLLPRLNPGSAVDGVLYFDTTVPVTVTRRSI